MTYQEKSFATDITDKEPLSVRHKELLVSIRKVSTACLKNTQKTGEAVPRKGNSNVLT